MLKTAVCGGERVLIITINTLKTTVCGGERVRSREPHKRPLKAAFTAEETEKLCRCIQTYETYTPADIPCVVG